MDIGAVLVIALLIAFVPAFIAYSRQPARSTFISFYIFSLIIWPLAFVCALLIKRTPPVPIAPGWYADPWGQAAGRYHDGAQWTGYTQPAQPAL